MDQKRPQIRQTQVWLQLHHDLAIGMEPSGSNCLCTPHPTGCFRFLPPSRLPSSLTLSEHFLYSSEPPLFHM